MSLRFDGRVVVVTGAARGIGQAYAQLLDQLGAAVVVNDVEPDDAVLPVSDTNDVATAAGARTLIDTTLERHGRVDAVIANAGIMRWSRFAELDVEDVHAHLAVHALGSLHVAQAAWPHFVDQGRGRILLTTSTGLFGLRGNAAYAMAKGALIGLVRNLAIEGARHGITANAIAPAASTRLAGEGGPDLPPALVAPMAAYLVHDDCPVSGEIYTAGGGRFARLFIATTPGWGGDDPSVDDVAANWDAINDEVGYTVPRSLMEWAAGFTPPAGPAAPR